MKQTPFETFRAACEQYGGKVCSFTDYARRDDHVNPHRVDHAKKDLEGFLQEGSLINPTEITIDKLLESVNMPIHPSANPDNSIKYRLPNDYTLEYQMHTDDASTEATNILLYDPRGDHTESILAIYKDEKGWTDIVELRAPRLQSINDVDIEDPSTVIKAFVEMAANYHLTDNEDIIDYKRAA